MNCHDKPMRAKNNSHVMKPGFITWDQVSKKKKQISH